MRRITMTAAAIAVSMTSTLALAQDKEWFTDSKYGEDLYDINFPGGTAAEYFNELGAELEGELNVIVKEGVDLVELPPINIKRVPGLDVIELPQRLDNALVIEGSVDVSPSFGGPRDGEGVYTIVVRLGPGYYQRLLDEAKGDGRVAFDLRFNGGTALDYVNAIREASPRANIIAMPGVERFPVPSVNLKDVTVIAALAAIQGQHARVDDAKAMLNLSDASEFVSGDVVRVFTLSLARHEPQVMTQVWGVSEIISTGVKEDDLLSAVRAALDLNELNATVRFHPETQLLMVRGSQATIDMVDSTLGEIQHSAENSQKQRSMDEFMQIRENLETRVASLEAALMRMSRSNP